MITTKFFELVNLKSLWTAGSFLLLLLMAACVPNRRIVYMQKDDVNKESPKDSVMRSYQLSITEYRIQPLDVLSVQFETLSEENDAFDFLSKLSPQQRGGGGGNMGASVALTGILVDAEGNIEYPVLGKIKLEGQSLFDAERTLQRIAATYVPDVVVRVRMLNFRFTVLGEVVGEKTVSSTNTRVSMLEAIGLAGGLTDLADRANVKLIRQVGGSAQVVYVNLLDESYAESPYYYVQQNDIIIVPPLKQRTFRQYVPANVAFVTSLLSLGLIIYTLTQTQNNSTP